MSRTCAIKVAVIDDDIRVCRSIARAIGLHGLKAVGVFETGEAALAALAECAPEIASVDMKLRDGLMQGPELISELVKCGVGSVALTGASDGAVQLAAVRAGALALVEKPCELETLVAAINGAANGVTSFDEPSQRDLARHLRQQAARRPKPPSPRQLEVLRLVEKGFEDKEIALLLKISVGSVNAHLKRVFRKLGVHSREEAAQVARASGLLDE